MIENILVNNMPNINVLESIFDEYITITNRKDDVFVRLFMSKRTISALASSVCPICTYVDESPNTGIKAYFRYYNVFEDNNLNYGDVKIE